MILIKLKTRIYEILEEADEGDRARDRQCAHYAAFLQERAAHLKGRRQSQAFEEILEEILRGSQEISHSGPTGPISVHSGQKHPYIS